MVLAEKSRVVMRRLDTKTRKTLTSKTRTDIHLQQKKNRIYHKLTAAERKAQEERREDKRTRLNARLKGCDAAIWEMAEELAKEFGYDALHWYHRLLQNARIAKTERKVNRWNAYVAMSLEAANAGKYQPHHHLSHHKLTFSKISLRAHQGRKPVTRMSHRN